jgi:hypothetical protein
VIITTLIIVSLSCYPITGIKNLLGNSSQKYVTTLHNSFNNNEDNRQTNHENNNQMPRWVRLLIDLIL